jgi:acetate kinase
VAVFDTAFHQTMPPVAYTYPVPYEWLEQQGVRRYGFHGTSHRFVARQALVQTGLPSADHALITAHLGNGCSCTAVRNGKSVDTTMGLTPLEGVMMGTRSGSVDPAILSHVATALGQPEKSILDALNKKSGLLGVSGVSNDVRVLLASEHPLAAEAIEFFVYRIVREIGALTAALGGLDALVFTAGIGENSPLIRQRVCQGLAWLGISIDADANQRGGTCISPKAQAPSVWVIPTDEEAVIASHTLAVVRRRKGA